MHFLQGSSSTKPEKEDPKPTEEDKEKKKEVVESIKAESGFTKALFLELSCLREEKKALEEKLKLNTVISGGSFAEAQKRKDEKEDKLQEFYDRTRDVFVQKLKGGDGLDNGVDWITKMKPSHLEFLTGVLGIDKTIPFDPSENIHKDGPFVPSVGSIKFS
jgi:hypothetical protein